MSKENEYKMKMSDSFSSLEKQSRLEIISFSVDKLKKFVEFMHDCSVCTEEKYQEMINNTLFDHEHFLEEFFGLSKRDMNLFMGDSIENYIDVSFSDDGRYVALNTASKYENMSTDVTFSNKNKPRWSVETRLCQGIVFNMETLEVTSMPREKVFEAGKYIDCKLPMLHDMLQSGSFTAIKNIEKPFNLFYDVYSDSICVFEDGVFNPKQTVDLVSRICDVEKLKGILKNKRLSVTAFEDDGKIMFLECRDLVGLNILWDSVEELFGEVGLWYADRKSRRGFELPIPKDYNKFLIVFKNGSAVKFDRKTYNRLSNLEYLSYEKIGEAVLEKNDWIEFKYSKIKDEEFFGICDVYRDRIIKVGASILNSIVKFNRFYVKLVGDSSDLDRQASMFHDRMVDDVKMTSNSDFLILCQEYYKYNNGNKKLKRYINEKLMESTIKFLNDSGRGNVKREVQIS